MYALLLCPWDWVNYHQSMISPNCSVFKYDWNKLLGVTVSKTELTLATYLCWTGLFSCLQEIITLLAMVVSETLKPGKRLAHWFNCGETVWRQQRVGSPRTLHLLLLGLSCFLSQQSECPGDNDSLPSSLSGRPSQVSVGSFSTF